MALNCNQKLEELCDNGSIVARLASMLGSEWTEPADLDDSCVRPLRMLAEQDS